MMHAFTRRSIVILLLTSLTMFAGCSGEDPQLLTLRKQLLLDAEPTDVSTIEDAKSQIATDRAVTFAGRVDLTGQAVAAKASTSFMVSEITDSDHDHGAGNDASDCPFCKHKAAKTPKAAVQFVDQAGKALPYDPAKLFGIQSGDVVVVRGQGEIIEELNLLNVTADGIFVRKP
jgi:hypothetical protein